jgi:hypothetical protein
LLILHPDPSVVGAVLARIDVEVAAFLAGLDAAPEPQHPEDVREHTEYVAALRSGADQLRHGGSWSVYAGESPVTSVRSLRTPRPMR